ncbi:MAG: DUF3299 domain-containing protein [Planctomycetaceae bacterium]|nr:DUF3299 domain-containing protein [Planctomycetaceae bacterium]
MSAATEIRCSATAEASSLATDLRCTATVEVELSHYRSISRAAIVSLVLGIVSFAGLAFSSLLVLPIVGVVLGLVGLSTIRRYPAEYTGGKIAAAGIALCSLLFVGGVSWHTYDYVTEVRPDEIRILSGSTYWDQLQLDINRPDLPVSPTSLELSGKKVFIKGYIHPGVATRGKVDRFILVPDFGTCCFGGDPKPTDMVEVFIPEQARRLSYTRTRVKLAGIFEVSQIASQRMQMKNPVWYHLEVYEVR